MSELTVAVLQFCPGIDQERNLKTAGRLLAQASFRGTRLAVLPEMFSRFLPAAKWRENAEETGGAVEKFLAEQALANRIYLVGGSYVEKTAEGEYFNTCAVFTPEGQLAGRYRKMHLFWTDIPGRTRYDERSYLSAGEGRFSFDADGFRVEVGICYDLRFPEFFRPSGGKPADIFCLPSAFMEATGAAHWASLVRARAIENLAYFAAADTAGTHFDVAERPGEKVKTWGHSMVVGPWGNILGQVDSGEGMAVAEISHGDIARARAKLAALEHIRDDLWPKRH